MVAGQLAQARTHTTFYEELGQYLLLLDDHDGFRSSPTICSLAPDTAPSEHLPSQLENRILDFATSELEKTKQRWKEWTQHNTHGITLDMMRIITNFCIVIPALGNFVSPYDHRTVALNSAIDNLTQSLVNFLTRPQTEQNKVDAVLEITIKNLPDIRCVESLSSGPFKDAGVLYLAKHLSKTLEDLQELKESFYAEEVDDFMMDLDQVPNSQPTGASPKPDLSVPRHDLQAVFDPAVLRATCSAYCQLISIIANSPEEVQDQTEIPSKFVDHLTFISEVELLRSRSFLKALFSTHFTWSTSSCLNLLERLSLGLLDPAAREHNTSEVALGMVVEVLVGTTSVWSVGSTDREGQDLYDNVEALYAHFVKGLVKKGVRRSANLQICVAGFLHGLLKHHPDFGQNRKVPSARTSLFEILAHGEIVVKYHIAEHLPTIFENFILSEHDKILQDVDSSLPSDAEWTEGIALRLLVLSRLASKWYTLLRQSVYRIFATAGTVERASGHAKRCIHAVARARSLQSSRILFKLFAPQIIFTWLDRKRKFSEIPFLPFGYNTLVDLLRDIESEAAGQAIMRGLQDEVDYLAKQLGTTISEILTKNIAKAAAYTLSWDTCRGSARNKADPSNAMLLRDLVDGGKDQYLQLVHVHFSRILGYVLQTINLEEKTSKALDKRPAFATTAKALAEMNSISHSSQDLDIGIEPSFSAFYLFDQLERLCRRTGDNPVTFWTPSIYTFVMRMLLDRIHPALGSLYARSVIRKIRILVALAGAVAYEGYPLQMTLQSLRPFLTDSQCAEDALGIMQYLFHHGAQYLYGHLSFMTGIGLSILISTRVFLGSSQDSTTQESQHTATMNKAQHFHAWFVTYLEEYAKSLSSSEDMSNVKAFTLITTAASQVRTEGNSFQGSEESKLLLQILDDVRSGRKLLNNTSREVALSLLCRNFQPAATAKDDVLGSDLDVAAYAPQIWESCQRSDIGDGYLLWAARVLGRTFSANGEVKRSADQSQPWSAQPHSSKDSLGKNSREAIVKKIIDFFYSDDRSEVSLAEDGVRLLISRLTNDSYVVELQNTIPKSIGDALTLAVPAEPESTALPPPETLEQTAFPTNSRSVSVWIRDLAVSLCQVASRDPILGSLPKLLQIDRLAERLFPYILHLVLLEEFDGERKIREIISEASLSWFDHCDSTRAPYMQIWIQALLYLRSQPTPKEVTRVDRDRWLEIDYLKAARAATMCGMHRSALLFAETSSGQPVMRSSSRRTSVFVDAPDLPIDLQLSIYKNLDEPDSFYGVDRGSSLSSVLDRLDYEGDGVKSLLFRGPRLDSQVRRSNMIESTDSRGVVKSLIMLNMNSITHSLLSNDHFKDIGDDVVDSTLHTARKLGQWDIKAPEGNHTESSTLFKAFQGLYYATDVPGAKKMLQRQLLATVKFLSGRDRSSISTNSRLRTLAVLTEADELLTTSEPQQLLDIWDQMKGREQWMRAGEYVFSALV
jgi:ataxia telangiectasia mutated family protein